MVIYIQASGQLLQGKVYKRFKHFFGLLLECC